MKTLLVIAPQPGFADAIRTMVEPERFRVIYGRDLWEVEPALIQGSIDACIYETDLTCIQPIRLIEALHKRLPRSPVFVYAGAKQWEWEEEACLHGATQVLSKPVRSRMLNLLLDRASVPLPLPSAKAPVSRPAPAPAAAGNAPHGSTEMLGVLRNFSVILSHSLQAEPLVKEFLLLLREILGINRAAVFLRQPPGVLSDPAASAAARRLRASCALGLPPELLGHFDLSLDAGVGGHIFRTGHILRLDSPEAENDLEIQKEFELLGAQVAVPILDRENLVGVALFDGRVTGEPLANGELGLVFHLLEELGLALKNIWLHDQLIANHDMMTDILRQLQSACLVVGWDLTVLHANEAAHACFGRPERRGRSLEFNDLPQVLGSKVFEVLKTSQPVSQFKHVISRAEPRTLRVTITPFRRQNTGTPSAVLLLAEDCTEEERLQALKLETANLRLVKVMAERLSHEVGNALVPLSTHQQLFDEKKDDPEFTQSLRAALDDGVRRVSRLASQMLYLARDLPSRFEAIPLESLVAEAFHDAQRHKSDARHAFVYENGTQPVVLYGDRSSLRHAFYEVLLNALQASPKDARIQIRSNVQSDPNGTNWVSVEVKDSGPGFTRQSAEQGADPFFTTRNVGLGLGLTVCRKIVETHRGSLHIEPPGAGEAGVVRILLPLAERGNHAPAEP